MLRSRQQKCSTASMPACCWINWQVTWALMRALARGPSGTLMQSMPVLARSAARRRFPSRRPRPRGGRISTNDTNLPAASFAPSFDFSAKATGSSACAFTCGSSTVTASFFCSGCSDRVSERISLMCSGVVPQQPPITFTPAHSRRRAYCAMYSGEHRYMLRPSIRMGSPALGMALIGFARILHHALDGFQRCLGADRAVQPDRRPPASRPSRA